MIVECNQCHAKFRLDDSKLNERGVKVRCSKCKHIFTVMGEGAATPEPDKTMVAGAPPPPPAKPKAAPPPPAPKKPPEPNFMPPPAPPKPVDDAFQSFDFKEDNEPPKESAGFDDGLGALSFADESPKPAPAAPEPDANDDFGDFSGTDEKALSDSGTEQDEFGDFDFDDDVGADTESTAPSAPSAPAAAPKSDDLLGDMPDFSASEPEPPLPSVPQAGAGDLGGSGDLGADDFGAGDFDLGGESAALPPPATPGPKAPAPGGDGIDEFGDISFDDSGMQDAPPPPSVPKSPAPSSGVDGLEIDRGVGGRTEDEFKQATGGGDDSYAFDAGSSELPDVEVPSRPAGRQETPELASPSPTMAPRPGGPRRDVPIQRGKKGGKKVIILLFIVAIFGGAYFFLRTTGKLEELKKIPLKEMNLDRLKEVFGLKEKVVPKDVWEFTPTAQRFYSVERAGGVKLWVLRGRITNRFTKGMRAILLEGRIKDGEVERAGQAMAGPQIADDKLRSLPMEKIREELMSTLDDKLEPRVLLTGDAIDFVLVIEGATTAKPTLMEPPVTVVKSDSL